MVSLEGPRLKLQRAAKHIDELRSRVEAYLGSDPFTVTEHDDPDGGTTYRIQVTDPVPLEWGAVAGDALHNLRSALDHLAWQLVLAGGGIPGRHTYFPTNRDGEKQSVAAQNALAGADPKAVRLATRLQRWSGAGILFALHELDVVDKHRLILIAGAAHKSVQLNIAMDVPWADGEVVMPPIAFHPQDRQFPIEDGATLLRIAPEASGGEMREPAFEVEICIAEGAETAGQPLLATLDDMHTYVARMLSLAEARLMVGPTV